jgi:branched-chain amino acid transport system ATP-binding protein
LLDEPSLGIAPALIQQIFASLKEINKKGTTLLLVEQDAYLALETAHRGYVIDTGEITLSGPASELLHNPKVQKAYLGQ